MNNLSTRNEILETITNEQWAAILAYSAERLTGKAVAMQPRSDQPCNLENNELTKQQLYCKVSNLLQRVGVPAHLKGYPYIKEALVLAYEDRNYLEAITKYLYPEIAKKFGTTSSRVERAIRHAIEVAIDHGDSEFHQKIFTMSPLKGKPTNGEAIAELVEYLNMY